MKYVKGITQFIQADHYGPNDFMQQQADSMGLSRQEYVSFYKSRTPESVEHDQTEASLNEKQFKHVRTLGQFVNEAVDKKKIEELQKEIEAINLDIEDLQNAVDNGDMDPEKAELQMSDLDAQKLELEEEIADLKKGGKKATNPKKLLALASAYRGYAISAAGAESSATKYEAEGTTDKKLKAKLNAVAAKLEKEEAAQAKLAEKNKKDVLAMLDKDNYTPEVAAYARMLMNSEFIDLWSKVSLYKAKAAAAEKVCSAYNNKCDDAAEWATKLKELKDRYFELYDKTDQLRDAANNSMK